MALGALLSIGSQLAGSAIQANAAKQGAAELNSALDVQGQADRLGFSLEDVFGTRLQPPEFDFEFDFDTQGILDFAKQVPKFNAREGVKYANQSARRVNKTTLQQLEAGMSRLFGGGGAFQRQRNLVNQNVEDQLEGRLSESTRLQLGRRALSGGASSIGPSAVNDTYAAYLGLTTEDIIQRGTENYRSLYQTYRQAFPLVTGADLMPYTTLPTSTGTQIGLAEAGLRNELGFQTSVAEYEAALNQAFAAAAPDPVASGLLQAELQRAGAVAGANLQANSALGSSVASFGSQIGGLFSGRQVASTPIGSSLPQGGAPTLGGSLGTL